jgi:leucyl aminopeptidase
LRLDDREPVSLQSGGVRATCAEILPFPGKLVQSREKDLDGCRRPHGLVIGRSPPRVNPHRGRPKKPSDSIPGRMRVEVSAAEPGELEVDVLGVPVAEPPDVSRLDERIRSRLGRLVESGELTGEPGSTVVLHLDGELAASRVAVAGVGALPDADSIRTAAAAVAREATRFGGTVGWVVESTLGVPPAVQARAAIEGLSYGAYSPGRWKSNSVAPKPIERAVLVGGDDPAVADAAERARRIAEWVSRARDLANAPPNELTPERLSARAAELAGEHLRVEALGHSEIEQLGMGAFGAVAAGSDREPQLIVMRYEPPDAPPGTTLGLVGKAVTFDTGGVSLKPALYMDAMKGDMAGGAAVIAATGAIADLGIPLRVLAVVAATENMPGGSAYRPGDIVRAMNGKTIEIINTDAEGRLILADALWYAREQGASHLLDLATLTGAMELALGDLYAGMFANDDAWRAEVLAAAEASGDHLWPFPLHRRYRRYIDSAYADMKNASTLRQASPALAAEFLHEFVGEGPWAHVDMAGPGFLDRSRGDFLTQQGGTGYGVRLAVELAERMAA